MAFILHIYQSSLIHAINKERTEVVRILLTHPDIDVNDPGIGIDNL